MGRNKSAKKNGLDSSGDPIGDSEPTVSKYDGWLHFTHHKDGNSQFSKELDDLHFTVRAGYDELMDKCLDGTEPQGSVKHIGDGIYELKFRQTNNPYRLLFIKWGRFLVGLTVFHKKDQKTSKTLAISRQKRWIGQYGKTPPS